MEIKNTNDLRQAYPELIEQIENAARESGVADERARIKALDDVANSVEPDMLMQAKYTQPVDARDMIYNAAIGGKLVGTSAPSGANMLNAMAADAQVVNRAGSAANGGISPTDPKAAETAQVTNLASKVFGAMKK